MSQQTPAWLPDTVSTNGEWNEVLARLYNIFERDFRQAGCRFQGRPVWWDQRKTDSPFEEGFWHLITAMDHQSGQRLPEPRRAERLPWCRPTLVHSYEPQVRVWDLLESSHKVRTYAWLEDWDYVVVLEKRPNRRHGTVAFLVTAYYVSGEQSRSKLRGKYANRLVQSQKCNHRPEGR